MADVKNSCTVSGSSDMYGIGIRLGFYLQWLASILASYLMDDSEIRSTRFALSSYTAAVVAALAVQTNRSRVTDLDRYVTILLAFGAQISIHTWRILTSFDADWDPIRWDDAAARSAATLDMFSNLVLAAIGVLQYAFWGSLPSDATERSASVCQKYGFLFVPVSLYSITMKAVNLASSTSLFLVSLLGWVRWLVSQRPARNDAEPKSVRVEDRRAKLASLGSLANLTFAAIVITGAELTLTWNNVQDVSDLDTPGQVISFVLGLVVFSRVVWRWWNGRKPASRLDRMLAAVRDLLSRGANNSYKTNGGVV
ncbi:hypothetical protein QBC42DRAFT_288478 [Cladorrhinum samala]|uniref:Uncharacterized protein n=1 Tax=Cladorrhinum samala TaxID=585594 RepID=A0AAV9HK95_9PEZI|nr:hypothetical protein QBC42DRAFT_288478 [Cladorrhinum samala]